MKNTGFLALFAILFLLSGCASVPVSDTSSDTSADTSIDYKKSESEKLLFSDWKYKGFGGELPVWAEAAYKNQKSELLATLPELQEVDASQIEILQAYGKNSDQAENLLKEKVLESEIESQGFVLYDSTWVRLETEDKSKSDKESATTYIYMAVFINKK